MSLGEYIGEKIISLWDHLGMLLKIISFGVTLGYVIGLLYVFFLPDLSSPYLVMCLLVWPVFGVCYVVMLCFQALIFYSIRKTSQLHSLCNSLSKPSLISFFLTTFFSKTKKFFFNIREKEAQKSFFVEEDI